MALKRRDIQIEFTEVKDYVQTRKDIEKYRGIAGVYVLYDANGGVWLKVGQGFDLADRFYKDMEDLEDGYMESVLEYIPEDAMLDEDYSFIILAYAPEFKYEFQRDFWLKYVQCKLILDRGTYSFGDETLTGDSYIPVDIQWDIYKAFSEGKEEE